MSRALDILRYPQGAAPMPVPIEPQREQDDDQLDLNTLLTTLRRRFNLFLGVLIAVLLIAVLLTYYQQPLFTAKSRVVLNMRQEQITPTATQGTVIDPADRVDTEVEVLQSRELAARVAQALHLDRDPNFNAALLPPSGFDRLKAGLFGPPEATVPEPRETSRHIVDDLIGSLEVIRLGETYAMEIGVTTRTPRNAARIANEYAAQYTQGQLREKLDENKAASRFLASRLDQLRLQAQYDTQRVQQYRIANDLLSTSGASLTEQEISAYNQAVATARAQAAEAGARLSTARAQLNKGSSGDDVGEALESSVVGGLRAQQAQVSAQLATLMARYSPNHPDVLKAQRELNDVDDRIASEIRRVISNLEAKERVSKQGLASIAGTLAGARGSLAQNNRAMAGLDDLQRRAQASQALYESYLNRYKETVAGGGTERPDASIISRAEKPGRQSSPKLILNLVLGLVIGVGAGLAAAFIAEMMFAGLTTGSEVEQKLKVHYLTGIPLLSSLLPRAGAPIDSVIADPHSGFAEAFRNLWVSLRYHTTQVPQVIAITSALPREGKTTVAICLARTMALSGEKIVVVDCDFTKAGLSRGLGAPHGKAGLAEMLQGDVQLDDIITIDQPSGAHVLGLAAAGRSLTDLMSSPELPSAINMLRQRYAYVVLDTAPILPIAEARLVIALADAVIFVARWRHTADHAIKAALTLIPRRVARNTGFVLSCINMRKHSKFGKGDAAFYYEEYGDYYKK